MRCTRFFSYEQLVPGLALGEKTRVVLDFGCGTGSLSVAMEQRGVTTLCVALSQSEEDGIQLVLERGYPGILTNSFSDSILVRLPYPNQAFDLLHCAACNISSWLNHHGLESHIL
jgi:cyclopropane fatty-acyl-phospholipid synthase-like methyltransferase